MELQHISRQQHDLPCCHHSTPASWEAGGATALLTLLCCRNQPETLTSHHGWGSKRADRNKPQRDCIFLSSLLSGDILLVTAAFSGLFKFLLRAQRTGNRNGGVTHSRSYPGTVLMTAWLLPSQQNIPKMNQNKLKSHDTSQKADSRLSSQAQLQTPQKCIYFKDYLSWSLREKLSFF